MTASTLRRGRSAAWTPAGNWPSAGASCFRSSGPPGPRAHPTWAALPAQPGHDITHNTFRAMAAAPHGPEGVTLCTVPALAQRPLASGGRATPLPAPRATHVRYPANSHPHPCTTNFPGTAPGTVHSASPPGTQRTTPPLTGTRKEPASTLYSLFVPVVSTQNHTQQSPAHNSVYNVPPCSSSCKCPTSTCFPTHKGTAICHEPPRIFALLVAGF